MEQVASDIASAPAPSDDNLKNCSGHHFEFHDADDLDKRPVAEGSLVQETDERGADSPDMADLENSYMQMLHMHAQGPPGN